MDARPPLASGASGSRLALGGRFTPVVLLAAALALATAGEARAGIVRYPGPAPCDTSIQKCIDGAHAGDRVELATQDPVDEDILLDKTLTLVPARGFSPLLGGGPVTRALSIVAGTGGGGPVDPISVTVTGLTMNNVQIGVALLEGADHRLEISECRLTHAVNSSGAVGIDVDVRVPAHVLLRRNVVITTGKPIRLFTALPDGMADFTLLGNLLTTSNPGLSSSGVAIDHRGAGTTRTDVHSNVIHDVAGCNCLSASGIDVGTAESADATVNIINNTLDNARAIQIRTPAFNSLLLVNVFNNIVTKAASYPVSFPARSLNLLINNGFNDLVKRSGVPGNFGGYLQGPGTFNLDPSYVGNGSYRLRAGSPLIDVGTALPDGGLPAEDADGNVRLARLSADMGAYEYGAPRLPSTTTTTSTVTSLTVARSTTTTTLPPECAPLATFDSISCRLEELTAVTTIEVPPGDVALDALVVAAVEAEQARSLVTPGSNGLARAALARAMRALGKFQARLRSRALRRLVPPDQRRGLRRSSQGIRHDLGALRRSLS